MAGTTTYTVTADDGQGGTVSDSFVVTTRADAALRLVGSNVLFPETDSSLVTINATNATATTIRTTPVGFRRLTELQGQVFGIRSGRGGTRAMPAELWSVDVGSPSESTKIGDLPTSIVSGRGLETHNGVVYAAEGRSLYEVNTTDPSMTTLLGTVGRISSSDNISGIASLNGVLYVGATQGGRRNQIWAVDPTNLASPTFVVNIGTRIIHGIWELVAWNGFLYLWDTNGNLFVRIDVSDNSITLVGTLPEATAGSLRGMTAAIVPVN